MANNCPIEIPTTVLQSGQTHAQMSEITTDLPATSNEATGYGFCTIELAHCHLQGGSLSPTWILLDKQSTVDMFSNPDLLDNIRSTSKTMRISCNAGNVITNQQGDLPGYGTVWFHPSGIANILSLSRVKDKFPVTFHNDHNKQFVVHKPQGVTRNFSQSPSGLFFLDITPHNVFTQTVAANKLRFTTCKYDAAVLAQKIQNTIGYLSTRTFLDILTRKLLPNCPVTPTDARNAELIFGPNVHSLKGKTVRRSSKPIQYKHLAVPPSILDLHRDVMLCADIMFVDRFPFFITISQKLNFGTVESIPNQKPDAILKAFCHVKSIYHARGF